MAFNKAQLQSKAKLREEEVEVEGVTLLLRQLSGANRDAYESMILVKKGKDFDVNMKLIRVKLVQLSLIDPDTGKPMFGPDQLDELNELPAAVITGAFEGAQKLNRLSKEDIEDLAKNSEGGPADDSSTDSPPTSE